MIRILQILSAYAGLLVIAICDVAASKFIIDTCIAEDSQMLPVYLIANMLAVGILLYGWVIFCENEWDI